jgi:thiol:disulfide interchange protein DsbD
VLILALALWMITPLLPTWIILFLAATLCLAYGVHLLHQRINKISAVIGVIFSFIGLIQLINVATGGRDALTPLSHLRSNPAPTLTFINIDSVDALNKAIASSQGKIIMLDFYADWCVSCKEMESFTFTKPNVAQRMDQFLLLQADVTANNPEDRALLKRFKLFGPPGIIFFEPGGRERKDVRVVGFQEANRFAANLDRVFSLK